MDRFVLTLSFRERGRGEYNSATNQNIQSQLPNGFYIMQFALTEKFMKYSCIQVK